MDDFGVKFYSKRFLEKKGCYWIESSCFGSAETKVKCWMLGLFISLKAIPVDPSLLLLYRPPGGAVDI